MLEDASLDEVGGRHEVISPIAEGSNSEDDEASHRDDVALAEVDAARHSGGDSRLSRNSSQSCDADEEMFDAEVSRRTATSLTVPPLCENGTGAVRLVPGNGRSSRSSSPSSYRMDFDSDADAASQPEQEAGPAVLVSEEVAPQATEMRKASLDSSIPSSIYELDMGAALPLHGFDVAVEAAEAGDVRPDSSPSSIYELDFGHELSLDDLFLSQSTAVEEASGGQHALIHPSFTEEMETMLAALTVPGTSSEELPISCESDLVGVSSQSRESNTSS